MLKIKGYRVILYGVLLVLLLSHNIVVDSLNVKYFDFILKPIVKIVEIYGGNTFTYVTNIGYVDDINKIIIAKECSGYKYFLISVALLVSMTINRRLSRQAILVGIFISPLLSYIVTIVANAMRIIVLLDVNSKLGSLKYIGPFIHQSIGVITYTSCLVFMYCIWNWVLNRQGDEYEEIFKAN